MFLSKTFAFQEFIVMFLEQTAIELLHFFCSFLFVLPFIDFSNSLDLFRKFSCVSLLSHIIIYLTHNMRIGFFLSIEQKTTKQSLVK